MTVVPFPNHRLYRCSRDDPDCEGCMFCEGGLGWCMTCHGAEGDLPSHCPQRPLTEREMQLISTGAADFFCGEWISPAKWNRS